MHSLRGLGRGGVCCAQTALEHSGAESYSPIVVNYGRNWSLLNRINQKGMRLQDKPVFLNELPAEDQAFIRPRLPELF